ALGALLPGIRSLWSMSITKAAEKAQRSVSSSPPCSTTQPSGNLIAANVDFAGVRPPTIDDPFSHARVDRNSHGDASGMRRSGLAGRNRSLSPLSSPAASMSMLKHHNATANEHLDASLLSLLMLA